MKKIWCVLAVVCLFGAKRANAAPVVLDFEDRRGPGAASYQLLPSNYQGLTWAGDFNGGWYSAGYGLPADCPVGGCSPDYLPESPWMAAFTRNGTVKFSAPTRFIGAWFSSQTNTALTFSFYSDLGMTNLVGSFTEGIEHTNNPLRNEFVAGPNALIQVVRVQSTSTVWIMDDFTYCAAGQADCRAQVPEPGIVALLGMALAGLARRRVR